MRQPVASRGRDPGEHEPRTLRPTCHHRDVTAFDLLLRGGTVIDGTGGPARRADVGVLGDRILAVGDLGAADPADVELVLDVDGRAV